MAKLAVGKLAGIAVLISLVIILSTWWITGALTACFDTAVAESMKISEANGCAEFWFNRYQTLLAAIIGAGVALVVVRPVFSQLREMNRQSAVAIRGIEESYARELEAELEKLAAFRSIEKQLSGFLEGYDDAIEGAQVYGVEFNNNYVDALKAAGEFFREISAMFARYPDGSFLSLRRREFLRAANAYRSTCDKVLTGFRNETFGPDFEAGEPEMTTEEVSNAREAATAARLKALDAYRALTGRLRSEIRAQWARVRHLQRIARGES